MLRLVWAPSLVSGVVLMTRLGFVLRPSSIVIASPVSAFIIPLAGRTSIRRSLFAEKTIISPCFEPWPARTEESSATCDLLTYVGGVGVSMVETWETAGEWVFLWETGVWQET